MFPELTVNHVEHYVADANARAAELVDGYGFQPVAISGSMHGSDDHYSVAIQQGNVHIVLTEPRSEPHRAHAFLAAHGDGVADIALATPDVRAVFDAAVSRGARPLAQPVRHDGQVTAEVAGCGDVRHTLIQRRNPGAARLLPGFTAVRETERSTGVGLLSVDHFALCLGVGDLTPAVAYYVSALGFEVIFEERIVVGAQAMLSKVVQSASRAVTLTLIQPDPTAAPGQIDEFLDRHGGSGVQHVALRTEDAVRTVAELAQRGVEFLDVPDTYYQRLREHLTLAAHTTAELRRLGILVDQDHDGQLFQIFTRSTHSRRTFFLEVIERMGARTFGSGNIRALYEAVEAERSRVRIGS